MTSSMARVGPLHNRSAFSPSSPRIFLTWSLKLVNAWIWWSWIWIAVKTNSTHLHRVEGDDFGSTKWESCSLCLSQESKDNDCPFFEMARFDVDFVKLALSDKNLNGSTCPHHWEPRRAEWQQLSPTRGNRETWSPEILSSSVSICHVAPWAWNTVEKQYGLNLTSSP